MEPPLELFVLTWGVYPRRVLLYLEENGLSASHHIKITEVNASPTADLTAAGKPPGSVPILRLPDGTFIKQSIAILDYFEDICANPDPEQPWQTELANCAKNKVGMRNRTAQGRARNRDMLLYADEATTHFIFACHKGTALFVPMETTHALTAKLALEYCHKNLKKLDEYYSGDVHLEKGEPATITDCVLYSTLHFSKEMYSLDLLAGEELPELRRFYSVFEQRESAQVEKDFYPAWLHELASQWLPVE